MRKATLVLGLVYALWGGWQIFTISRLLSLYEQFNAEPPQSPFLLTLAILVFSIICLAAYFMHIKNHVIYKVLVFIGTGGFITYFVYLMWAGNVANKQVYEMINEIQNPR